MILWPMQKKHLLRLWVVNFFAKWTVKISATSAPLFSLCVRALQPARFSTTDGNFLKIQYEPCGHPYESRSPPPANEPLRPMAAGPGYHGDSFAWQVAATTSTAAATAAAVGHPLYSPHFLRTRPFCLPPLQRTNRT